MSELINLTLQALGWLLYGLWKLLGNFLGLGLLCVLTALYGVGSDWPLAATFPIAAVGLVAWTMSIRGGLLAWREGRAGREQRAELRAKQQDRRRRARARTTNQ